MESIADLKKALAAADGAAYRTLLEQLSADPRKGVAALLAAEERRRAAQDRENARQESLLRFERECFALGAEAVAGVDEVGRGPLAGPVVAAAVILPRDCRLPGVDDSKKLTAQKREALYQDINEKAAAIGYGVIGPEVIDRVNILQATFLAMKEAIAGLGVTPDWVLVDGNFPIPDLGLPQRAIVGGDGLSLSVAAASIVAKVVRDDMLREYDSVYPGYGFAQHKGYGTQEHRDALQRLGPCPIHRKSFLRNLLADQNDSTHAAGARGEDLAAAFLAKRGLMVLEHNYRRHQGEIDLVCRQGETRVFVEVKLRRNDRRGAPAEAVDARKRRRICQAAKAYLYEHRLGDAPVRFDVVEVYDGPSPELRHIENAFWEE